MRIALFTNRYPVDAHDDASPFVRDFCHALCAEGCTIRVLTPRYAAAGVDRDPWVERFTWSDSDRVLGQLSLWRPAHLFRAVTAVRAGRTAALRLVETFRPDVILALWALPSGYWAHAASRACGTPYAVWCLGSDVQVWGRRPLLNRYVKSVLAFASACYADGYALAAEASALAGRACAFLPSQRLLVPAPEVVPRHPRAGRPYFLFLGRLSRAKGVLDLLRAAPHVKRREPFEIVFAGIPDRRLDVARQIRKRGLGSICIHAGRLPEAELPAYLLHAEAVILPSRRDSIPLVLGEAIQAGVPVVCSDLPDFQALLERYHLGVTFPVGQPRALAHALTAFKRPASFRTERTRFLLDFNPNAAARRLLADLGTHREAAAPPGVPAARKDPAHV